MYFKTTVTTADHGDYEVVVRANGTEEANRVISNFLCQRHAEVPHVRRTETEPYSSLLGWCCFASMAFVSPRGSNVYWCEFEESEGTYQSHCAAFPTTCNFGHKPAAANAA